MSEELENLETLEEQDIDSLVEVGLRAIDTTFFKRNIRKIRAYTQRLNEPEFSDIFLGIRNKRFTFYYYGRELLTLDFSNGDENNFIIQTRAEFGNNEELNNKLKEVITNIPLEKPTSHYKIIKDFSENKKSGHYIIKTSELSEYSNMNACIHLLKGLKELMKQRYPKGITSELQVQGEYMTRYNFTNNKFKDLYMIDMEFILSSGVKEKVNCQVEGRYDMIGLYLTKEGKYKLVFIELKSKRDAIKNKTSGINNHIDDMDTFLSIYNNKDMELKNLLVSNIKSIIELKGEKNLKLIKGLDINKIDFDNPEFWLLFDMVDKTKVDTIEDIKKIINTDIHNMEKSNTTLRLFKGHVRNQNDDFIEEIF